MKREVIENSLEKDFVASLIMSDKCCNVLIPHIQMNYFECDYSRVIISWVMDYYKKFKKAPKKEISSIYKVRCDEIVDEALKDLVYQYLKNVADSEIDINNEEYLLDQSRDYLDYQRMKEHVEQLQACLETRSMDKARKIQSSYDRISVAQTNECALLDVDNAQIIKDALKKEEEVLFTMPGELNNVIGNIHRDDFIMVMAAAKKGKSWFLQQFAIEAMKQRLNVVFVCLEMTREEVIQRMWKTLFGTRSGLVKPGTYESSRFVDDTSEQGKSRIELIDVKVDEQPVPEVETLQQELRVANYYTGNLRVISYPAGKASAQDITDRVEELAKDGFVADVLIVDYADITKPIGGGTELRNQLNAITMHFRGFSMAFHCATITATQTNRSGYNSSVVDANAIAEDYRKITHVTSLVSMEQTHKMKKNHIMRVRNVALRNGEVTDTCIFPQCLALGQFIFGKPIQGDALTVIDEEDEEEDNG